MAASIDCLCAGIIVADMVCQPIDVMPPAGALVKTERIEFSIGGCSANMAVDMTRLGLNVGLSGRVGQDLFAREVRERLNQSGVDTTRLEESKTTPTSSTFVVNVKGEDRRFIHCVGANAEFDGTQLGEDDIRSAKSIFLGGYCLMEAMTPERVMRLFRIAREAGVITGLNVVIPEKTDMRAWLSPVFAWTDYFFCNNDEAEQITGESDVIRQAEALQKLGVRTAVVTHGHRGAVVFSPDQRLRAGVYPVKPIDGTGTGDAFASGFLYGLLRRESLVESLKLGTALGASCVRSMGATTGVFNEHELRDYVAANPLVIESF